MKKNNKTLISGYDYSTPGARTETVPQLFDKAKAARTVREAEWEKYNDYYNFIHDVSAEVKDFCDERDLPWTPAVCPDPWIMVESQLDPTVPEPEFHGRDDDMDSEKARQREFAVRYICENNRLSDLNTRNERRLLKLGDAFWKAYWDSSMRCGVNEGDIRITDIPVEAIFPDPSVRNGTIQDGQYLDYVYSLHKVKFCQLFRKDLERLGIRREDIMAEDYVERAGLFDMTTAIDDMDDTVQILEHWFRQPEDTKDENGSQVPAGAVACSIQAGGKELRYIPNYWERTCKQNQLFPFVHYWRIQDENQVWNKSELFPIMDLVDAADRKLAMAILNDAFMANDIVMVEEGALADGEELTNEPGAVIKVKKNMMAGVRRLGGLQSMANASMTLDWFKNQIERTNRNYETNMGQEAARVTTATGLAILHGDAQAQSDIKRNDRHKGFERLYELLDWLALEFFDDDRMLFIGADEARERPAKRMKFNADTFAEQMPEVYDLDGNVVRESWTYWPRVDVTITAGDSVVKGKQATLQALQALTASQVTAENWRLFAAQLQVLDIPGKQEIIKDWERRFSQPAMLPEQQAGGGGTIPGAGGEMPGMGGELPGVEGIEGTRSLPMLDGVQM